jgi:ActR/RegA family two-component response regulator
MMRILFLDDDDQRHKAFKRASAGAIVDRACTAREAILLLGQNAYDRAYLDYDLDDDPSAREMDDYESGQAVADWIADNAADHRACLFIVHSRCKHGARDMQATLESAGLHAVLGEWTWRPDRHRNRRGAR